MSDKKKFPKEVAESAHKIWMAGLGALATAEEEGGKAFKKLVEKGEAFEKRFDAPLGKVKEKTGEAKSKLDDTLEKFESTLNDRIAGVLGKMGVPTKDEINKLTERVEALMAGIEKLQTTGEEPAAPKKTARRKSTAAAADESTS